MKNENLPLNIERILNILSKLFGSKKKKILSFDEYLNNIETLIDKTNEKEWGPVQAILFDQIGIKNYIIPLFGVLKRDPEKYFKFVNYVVETHSYHYSIVDNSLNTKKSEKCSFTITRLAVVAAPLTTEPRRA